MEKSRKPKIRFKGFTDDWEQRKLGELVQFSKGNGYSKRDLEEVGTPIILYGRLYTNYETVISDVDTYVCAKSGSVYSRGGEVIVPASGETSEDISIASVVEKPGFLLGGDLNIITPSIQLDSVFLAISISNGKPHNVMAKMAQGKSVVHLHNSDLEKIDLLFPEHDEQARISSCIRGIDYLITLHQRKLEKLMNVKKSMLEKMFPKRGSDVPEIRFFGFTDAWEQRELGNVGQTYTGLSGKTKDDFGHGHAQFVTYMNVFSNPISNPKMNEPIEVDSKQNEVEVGDVFFTTSSETPKEVGMTSVLIEKQGKMYLNSFCFGYRLYEKYDSYYLAYMLRSNSFREKIIMLAQGISRYNISKNKVMEIDVFIPSYKEQMEIGKYFRDLDTLITLHQRKLEKLKNIKKSMLEKMFI